ncbi:DUF3369 domain-containing protein [Iodobacter ciconiae]|uniref:DUF3369 domain-containing protein n=1 Tax=Iodobacter ciconiae TaxID=2496266 RepID=A0A3S8ZVB2_9NEIS|nr:DUF3369 domain-containing protein [Iodobacter ciconiae]AZN37447.1 DUF3369 domain-containing protein [Iodobacter ciconiae]
MADSADDDWLEEDSPGETDNTGCWTILIVDDEPDIHHVTRLALANIKFLGKQLEILSCYSGAESLALLSTRHDIALVLLDVVMEQEDSGLQVAHAIRETLGNHQIRIILRTGQPGMVPERRIIENYDINDYKAKTELTRDKLYTAILGTLRSYKDIMLLEYQRQMLAASRRGLMKVIEASASIFKQQSIQQFAQGVLEQLQSLLFFEQEALYISVQSGIAALSQNGAIQVIHATGGYEQLCGKPLELNELLRFDTSIKQAIQNEQSIYANDHFVGFFHTERGPVNLLIIDGPVALSNTDKELIELFCHNAGIAFENLMMNKEIQTMREGE